MAQLETAGPFSLAPNLGSCRILFANDQGQTFRLGPDNGENCRTLSINREMCPKGIFHRILRASCNDPCSPVRLFAGQLNRGYWHMRNFRVRDVTLDEARKLHERQQAPRREDVRTAVNKLAEQLGEAVETDGKRAETGKAAFRSKV
jgi:hypothetical protein